jgi:hypothetical protein
MRASPRLSGSRLLHLTLIPLLLLLLAPSSSEASDRVVLFADRDDDDVNAIPDAEQPSIPPSPELFSVPLPPKGYATPSSSRALQPRGAGGVERHAHQARPPRRLAGEEGDRAVGDVQLEPVVAVTAERRGARAVQAVVEREERLD